MDARRLAGESVGPPESGDSRRGYDSGTGSSPIPGERTVGPSIGSGRSRSDRNAGGTSKTLTARSVATALGHTA